MTNVGWHVKVGKKAAIYSLIIGSAIFVFFYKTGEIYFLIGGLLFAIMAAIVNSVFIISFLIHCLKDVDRTKFFGTFCLMVVNIPVCIFYYYCSLYLLNTMRITFVNEYQNEIKKINILGCERNFIDKIEPGESKTVWIEIPNDCSISVNYLHNEKKVSENVIGYVTPLSGAILTHNFSKVK